VTKPVPWPKLTAELRLKRLKGYLGRLRRIRRTSEQEMKHAIVSLGKHGVGRIQDRRISNENTLNPAP
jgi:hypothetical protein